MEKTAGRCIQVGDTIYIDRGSGGDGPVAFLTRGVASVYTGLEVCTEQESPLLDEINRLCGLDFFREEQPLPLYGVPCLCVFARDSAGGCFAGGGAGLEGAPIFYIDSSRVPHPLAPSLAALLRMAVEDPDWRCKCLPGSWPRLPEGPRDRLAADLRLPRPEGQLAWPVQPPRVFASREEAEREFPIRDAAELIRQRRFQVRPMITAQERAGRAFVHYTAWREAYAGILDSRILDSHTLARCQEVAEKYPENTLVLTDRDKVVGFARYEPEARDFVTVPDAAEVSALYVLEAYQGQGLGRMLMDACLDRLERPRVALYVLEGNEKAIGFYKHMGFRMTGNRMAVEMDGGEMAELEMVLDRPGILAGGTSPGR